MRTLRTLFCLALSLSLVLLAARLPLHADPTYTWRAKAAFQIDLDDLDAIEAQPERRVAEAPRTRRSEGSRGDEAARKRRPHDDLRLGIAVAEGAGEADDLLERARALQEEARANFRPASLLATTTAEVVRGPRELSPQFEGPPSVGNPPKIDMNSVQVSYPEKARRRGVQGRVILTFLVETDGRAYDIRVLQPLHPACDAEAIRAVRDARFTPGQTNGRHVPANARLAIRFQLRSS